MRLASYGGYYNELCSLYATREGVCIKNVEFWLLIFMPYVIKVSLLFDAKVYSYLASC